ncbi:uncharacterized protein LOC123529611 [Mercenaria mercenaria]|uniref:uncharacterized protein LOC123529611 n=1 Tax=Mercenaria mercenaria TaxID=6596 RepID=UPI00234E89E7|nr:uncharacterized protein LOC123529611 [Mercenaria mercenaria]
MECSKIIICFIAVILEVSICVFAKVPRAGNVFSSENVLKTEELKRGGWQMVFRATSGNGDSVYDAWTKGTKTNADKPVAMTRSYGLHYRSSFVSNWSNISVEFVKFAFYDEDREVAHVILNGKNSDINNWFDKTRVLSSSWPDLTSKHTYNYFSIAGHYMPKRHDRRFFINRSYAGCPKDLSHMVVINSVTPAVCQWDSHATYPQFLYSKINSVDFFDRRMFGTADYMAIFIKRRV